MTDLQLKVIEELQKYYGWSDIVDDSSLSIELIKDTINATTQVVKNLTIPDVMASAFVVKVNQKSIVVVAKTKEEIMNRLRDAGLEWKTIRIEALDEIYPHLL